MRNTAENFKMASNKSDSVRKKKNKERQDRFRQRNVEIGVQRDRWLFIKAITNSVSDREVAVLLIDR